MALTKKLTAEQKSFVDLTYNKYGPNVSRKQVLEVAKENGLPVQWWILSAKFKEYRSRRGLYNLDTILSADEAFGTDATVVTSAEDVSDGDAPTPTAPAAA